MMRDFIQAGSVVAFALGAGLFALGSYLQPPLNITNVNPADIARIFDHVSDYHVGASVTRGIGVGFMTLGGLGLIVPWINAFLARERPRPETAQSSAGPTV
jgi:hypothetical protein